MDRISKVLLGLDVGNGSGLEIGPLTNPILRRPNARVCYVDHVDTERLRQKYADDAAVDCQNIAPVDVIWTSGPLRVAVDAAFPEAEQVFDHVVASHVIEHVPDLVWWLHEIRSVLKPGGALRLIVPDRRFTMDLARRETGIADALAAYLGAARRPQPREIIDFYCNYTAVDRNVAWQGVRPGRDGCALFNSKLAIEKANAALGGEYNDVHCSVFTPASFTGLMVNLARLDLLDFKCTGIFETVEGDLDFFVHLEVAKDRSAIGDSWTRAGAGLRSQAAVTLPQEDAATLFDVVEELRGELQQARLQATADHDQASAELARQRGIFERSTSWRVTAPMRRLRRLVAGR